MFSKLNVIKNVHGLLFTSDHLSEEDIECRGTEWLAKIPQVDELKSNVGSMTPKFRFHHYTWIWKYHNQFFKLPENRLNG